MKKEDNLMKKDILPSFKEEKLRYDRLRLELPEVGALCVKIRAEFMMHNSLAVVFLISAFYYAFIIQPSNGYVRTFLFLMAFITAYRGRTTNKTFNETVAKFTCLLNERKSKEQQKIFSIHQKSSIMTTQEVANKFYEYMQQGAFDKIYGELYSPNATSEEAPGSDWGKAEGMNAIHEKGKKWNEGLEEMHGGSTAHPLVGGDYFACHMTMDFTPKGGPRTNMSEIALYKVKDGKIVSEQFFY
jgi:hypothetical protein